LSANSQSLDCLFSINPSEVLMPRTSSNILSLNWHFKGNPGCVTGVQVCSLLR